MADEEEFKQKDSEPSFDLSVALKALAADNPEQAAKLATDEASVRDLRIGIASVSRKNFILERELGDIDEKIKLLIKNRISVQEVMGDTERLDSKHGGSGGDSTNSEGHSNHPLRGGKRQHYEELFYLLQKRPRYLAKLARLVQAKDVPNFVQTVVFDMYGDQYDTREERLLLALFRRVLKLEIDATTDKGSLLRANTAVTQMLSAYARRGQGLSILKDILEEPLKKIVATKNLNLEIKPLDVYKQLITDYETEKGQKSPLNPDVDDDAAAENEEVKKIVEERTKQLVQYCELILGRIIAGVENIPYGVRWICKQLGVLCKARFPDADRYQIGSLIGGYIYLRFFNPVIVTPDTVNFVTKPSKIMRRNLVLIAKVLQNLSNGLMFGDKEMYMRSLNKFLTDKRDPLQDYFDKLIAVDDLEDSLQVDKYLEHTGRQAALQVSFNQIFLVHQLCHTYLAELIENDQDPIKDVLNQLGAAPAQVDKDANETVMLTLSGKRLSATTAQSPTADVFLGQTVNPLFNQAKSLLLFTLQRLPHDTTLSNLMPYLEQQCAAAVEAGNGKVALAVSNVMSMMISLQCMGLLVKKPTLDETFNGLIWGIAQESLSRASRISTMAKRLQMIKTANDAVKKHGEYLQSRLEMYKIYLENVRKGPPDVAGDKSGKKGKEKVANKVVKFTHNELEKMGVVTHTNPDIQKSILQKCYYSFTMVQPGRYSVELHLKKGIDLKLLKKPVELVLEELLHKQEHGETQLEMDHVTLSVNLLIHLLNNHFVKK